MTIILTPTRARFSEDIKIRETLLKETVKDEYRVGFEVILLGGLKGDFNHKVQIVKNLESFSNNSNFYLSLHAPCERNDFKNHSTDLSTYQGLDNLASVINFGKSINAKSIVVHSENFHIGEDLLKQDISKEYKETLREKVMNGMVQVKKSCKFNGNLCIENVPYPLTCDDENNISIEKMVVDPVISFGKDIVYFSKNSNIDICVDTCHYGISKKSFNAAYLSFIPNRTLKENGFIGEPDLGHWIQPDLDVLVNNLGDSLKYVHLSDFSGVWVPGKSCFKEGLVPGDGEFEPEIRRFLKKITKKDIPINVEVKDVDLKNPVESRRGIAYLMNILSD